MAFQSVYHLFLILVVYTWTVKAVLLPCEGNPINKTTTASASGIAHGRFCAEINPMPQQFAKIARLNEYCLAHQLCAGGRFFWWWEVSEPEMDRFDIHFQIRQVEEKGGGIFPITIYSHRYAESLTFTVIVKERGDSKSQKPLPPHLAPKLKECADVDAAGEDLLFHKPDVKHPICPSGWLPVGGNLCVMEELGYPVSFDIAKESCAEYGAGLIPLKKTESGRWRKKRGIAEDDGDDEDQEQEKEKGDDGDDDEEGDFDVDDGKEKDEEDPWKDVDLSDLDDGDDKGDDGTDDAEEKTTTQDDNDDDDDDDGDDNDDDDDDDDKMEAREKERERKHSPTKNSDSDNKEQTTKDGNDDDQDNYHPPSHHHHHHSVNDNEDADVEEKIKEEDDESDDTDKSDDDGGESQAYAVRVKESGADDSQAEDVRSNPEGGNEGEGTDDVTGDDTDDVRGGDTEGIASISDVSGQYTMNSCLNARLRLLAGTKELWVTEGEDSLNCPTFNFATEVAREESSCLHLYHNFGCVFDATHYKRPVITRFGLEFSHWHGTHKKVNVTFTKRAVSYHEVRYDVNSITITCEADGWPKPEAVIMQADNPSWTPTLHVSPFVLNVTEISGDFLGRFSCLAGNAFGDEQKITDLSILRRGPQQSFFRSQAAMYMFLLIMTVSIVVALIVFYRFKLCKKSRPCGCAFPWHWIPCGRRRPTGSSRVPNEIFPVSLNYRYANPEADEWVDELPVYVQQRRGRRRASSSDDPDTMYKELKDQEKAEQEQAEHQT